MKPQATFGNVWVEAFKLVISNLNGWSKSDLGKRSSLRMGGKTTVIDCQEEDTPEAMTHGAHPWAVERSDYMHPHTAQGLDHNAQLFYLTQAVLEKPKREQSRGSGPEVLNCSRSLENEDKWQTASMAEDSVIQAPCGGPKQSWITPTADISLGSAQICDGWFRLLLKPAAAPLPRTPVAISHGNNIDRHITQLNKPAECEWTCR